MSSPRLHELYLTLKDTQTDKTVLLVCMGLNLETIKQIERQNFRQDDRAFMECLDHYLKSAIAPAGSEWEHIVKALRECKDHQTADKIQSTHIGPHGPTESLGTTTGQVETDSYDYDYTMFQPPPTAASPSHPPLKQLLSEEVDEAIEYLEKMKTNAKTKYNEAKTRIEDCAYEIDITLDREHENAKRSLSAYKQKVGRSSDKLDSYIHELVERTTAQQAAVQDALNRLKCGDSTGLVTIKESSNDLLELEKLTNNIEKNLERYKRHTPRSYIGSSTKDTVTQDLQAILIINSYTCTELDENEYQTVDDLINSQ